MSLIAINTVVWFALLAASLAGTPSQNTPAVGAGIPVTVVGCLKTWEPAMARSGAWNPAKLAYVLTDLGPGTTAAPALPNVMRYLVKAKDISVALSPHMNHRIEVTGLVTGLGKSTPNGRPLAPTLTVATLKMVSTECLEVRAPSVQ